MPLGRRARGRASPSDVRDQVRHLTSCSKHVAEAKRFGASPQLIIFRNRASSSGSSRSVVTSGIFSMSASR